MKQTISFEFETEKEINLRDVFYTVERAESKCYYAACPACDNEKKITHRGETYTCPRCHGYGGDAAVLRVEQYTVKRWRVKNMIFGFNMYEWKPPKNDAVEIELGRNKRGDNYCQTMRITQNPRNKTLELRGSHGEAIMADYAAAIKIADEKNAESAALVKEYNEKHGTTFEFEKPVYDAKSR